MINQIASIKDNIKLFLTKYESMRDNDNELIAFYWYRVMKTNGIDESKYTSLNFLGDYSKGKYPSAESIRRCRQKIQEQFPQLRGKSYKNRHENEQDFRNQIKSI
jgi:hypothetical protein